VVSTEYRVGIIADIHGSLLALRVVYADLRRKGVDRIVCAGDVAMFGPEPNEVIAFLDEHDVQTAQGNEDEAMLAPIVIPQSGPDRLRQLHTIRAWSQGQLSHESIAWLEELPDTVAIEPGFLCVHASPMDKTEIVERESPKPFPAGIRCVCAGHLHRPFVAVEPARIWVNAGSVSRPTDGDPRGSMAIVSLRQGSWSAEVIRFELPISEICARIRNAEMPYSSRICESQALACWF
jgi:predicted phosphodiesterase